MPTFEYQATDASGAAVQGNAVGANLESVLRDLGQRGFTVDRINVAKLLNDPLADVVDIPPKHAAPKTEGSAASSAGATFEEARAYVQSHVIAPVLLRAPLPAVGFFFRQLGTMENAGVPIVQSMDTLAAQARDPRLKPMLEDVSARVKAGYSISTGLERYPETITPVMLSLVRVGEQGGFLADALTMVSDYIDREIHLRNMYKRSTFYPKLILVVSFIVIGACNTIIASVAPGQQGLKSPLGFMTWVALAAVGLGIWLFLRIGLVNPEIKYQFDKYTLKVPVLGHTLHQLAMAKFGRAFGAMYKAGVPLSNALPLAADACGNEYLRQQIKPHLKMVEGGGGIHDTLARTNAFSRIVLDMVSTGERTGNMEQMVTKISEYYEDEAETRQNTLAVVTGVVLLLLMAVYIGYMVITFYSGHYSNLQNAADGIIPFWRFPLK